MPGLPACPRALRWPRILFALGILFALAVVGACTGTLGGSGVVYYTNFTAGYVPSSLAASQPVLVETYGSPAQEVSPEAVSAATVQGLRTFGPSWMPRNYADDAAAAERAPYRLRIAYAAPRRFKLDQICKTPPDYTAAGAAGSSDEGPSTRTLAGLCRGESVIAMGEGSPGSAPDISGERFQRFVGLLGRKVMPRRNPVTQDDCVFRVCD